MAAWNVWCFCALISCCKHFFLIFHLLSGFGSPFARCGSGLAGTAVAILLFGLSSSYLHALCLRFLWGLSNGNISVSKVSPSKGAELFFTTKVAPKGVRGGSSTRAAWEKQGLEGAESKCVFIFVLSFQSWQICVFPLFCFLSPRFSIPCGRVC